MNEEDFYKTYNIMVSISNHGDFNYLQTLVFDWREKRNAIKSKAQKWNFFATSSGFVVFLTFVTSIFTHHVPFIISIFALINFIIFPITLGFTIHYNKQIERYQELIDTAQKKIKEL